MPRFLLVMIIMLTLIASAKGEVLDIRESGQGETRLVFIAGLASSHDVWTPWREQYQTDYRVLTIQLAGFAGVAPPEQSVTDPIGQAAEELSERLRQDGAPVIVVGHSLGGQLALQVAKRLPEQVDSVLVVDSLPFLAAVYWPQVSSTDASLRAEQLGQFMRQQDEAPFRQQQRASLGRLSKNPAFLPTLTAWADASDKAVVINTMEALLSTDYRAGLKAIEAPVTVMLAWDGSMPLDREALEALYREQYTGVESLSLLTVEDSYHFIMQDQPQAFGRALAQFLED